MGLKSRSVSIEHGALAGNALPRHGGFEEMARNMNRAGGVGDPWFHGCEQFADSIFDVRLEFGIGLRGQYVGGAFDEFRQVEIARVTNAFQAVPDGNGAVRFYARGPKFVADFDLRQGHRGRRIIRRRSLRHAGKGSVPAAPAMSKERRVMNIHSVLIGGAISRGFSLFIVDAVDLTRRRGGAEISGVTRGLFERLYKRVTMNLFENPDDAEPRQEQLGPGAMVLRQFANAQETSLLSALEVVVFQGRCSATW